MRNLPFIRRYWLAYTTTLVSALSAATPAAATPSIASIVRTFAEAAISAGYAPGVEVAVVHGSAKPTFYGFGVTTVGTANKPTPTTLFQIASVTKVFTTNLLGQAVQNGTMDLGMFKLNHEAFSRAHKISIDYAVMERTDRCAVIPADMGWSLMVAARSSAHRPADDRAPPKHDSRPIATARSWTFPSAAPSIERGRASRQSIEIGNVRWHDRHLRVDGFGGDADRIEGASDVLKS